MHCLMKFIKQCICTPLFTMWRVTRYMAGCGDLVVARWSDEGLIGDAGERLEKRLKAVGGKLGERLSVRPKVVGGKLGERLFVRPEVVGGKLGRGCL